MPRISRTSALTAVLAFLLIAGGLVLLSDGPDAVPAPGADLAGQRAQAAAVEGIERQLHDAGAPLSRTYAQPPVRRQLAPGVWSLATIPRLDLSAPVHGGTDAEALAQGLGHWRNGVGPGQRGNFVLVGHRVTETEPFKDFPALRPGDVVRVRTSNAT